MRLADHLLDQPRACRSRRTAPSATLRPLRKTVTPSQISENVVEEMRDEDDAAPLIAQPAQHSEQRSHLGRRQGRGRLVENDDAGAREQHAGKLDQLLHARSAASPMPARWVDVDARDSSSCSRGAAHHRRPLDEAEAVRRLRAEIDVLGDRSDPARRREFLMHHADARRQRVTRRGKVHRTGRPGACYRHRRYARPR